MSVDYGLTIRPEIRNGQVITLDVEFESLALKAPIPLEVFPEVIKLIEQLSIYVDFGGQSGWTLGDIDQFIFGEISEKANFFFRILSDEADWLDREVILSYMEVDGRVLAGALSSPGQFFSRYKKDPIYEKRVFSSDDGSEKISYRIKPLYLALVKQAFET